MSYSGETTGEIQGKSRRDKDDDDDDEKLKKTRKKRLKQLTPFETKKERSKHPLSLPNREHGVEQRVLLGETKKTTAYSSTTP